MVSAVSQAEYYITNHNSLYHHLTADQYNLTKYDNIYINYVTDGNRMGCDTNPRSFFLNLPVQNDLKAFLRMCHQLWLPAVNISIKLYDINRNTEY